MATSCKVTSWFLLMMFFINFCQNTKVGSKSNGGATREKFNAFILKYKKTYKEGTQEYETRFKNFKDSLNRHVALNKNMTTNDSQSATYGINKFSDLSLREFEEMYLSDGIPGNVPLTNSRPFNAHHMFQFPDPGGNALNKVPMKVDWRTKNAVSPVRNQKSCGGCWAFSTVETIESAYAIKTNSSPPVLSVQQVIDCAVFGNFGCKGGGICSAMFWMNYTTTQLVSDKQYPLTDTSEYCKIQARGTGRVGIRGYHCNRYIGREEFFLLQAIANGPVAVSVDARTWNDYLGGIIKYHCSNYNNHAVQIVGYDLTGIGSQVGIPII